MPTSKFIHEDNRTKVCGPCGEKLYLAKAILIITYIIDYIFIFSFLKVFQKKAKKEQFTHLKGYLSVHCHICI